jgi:type VII ESX secretion system EccE translocon-like protein
MPRPTPRVLSVRPEAFALCDSGEQARRLAGWGAILAGVAREASPIRRMQWVERTAPADDGELVRAAQAQLAFRQAHPIAQGYLELVSEAGPATQAHETYVAVQVDRKRAARLIRAAGGGGDGAVAVLRREIATLISNLAGADVTVTGVLAAREVARTIRVAFDPGARAALSLRAALDPEHGGVAPAAAWPAVVGEEWGWLRADDAYHATFWVEEWPRIPVRPDFLSPLLLGSRATRTVSLTVEAVSPGRAARQVEAARTADLADEELRRRGGFLSSARRRRQAEGVARREEELADGHADCRFSGYVTVSAPDLDALEDACGEVEQLAQQCRLQLTRLRGQQAEAFTWTLPLARGLR